MSKLNNLNSNKTLENSRTGFVTEPKLSENLKTQIVTKLKCWQTKTKKICCYKTQTLKLWQKFETQIVIKLKFLKFDINLKLK